MRKLRILFHRNLGFCLGIAIITVVLSQAGADVTVTKLNGPLVEGGTVLEYLVSPDGEFVVYAASQDTAGTFELYSVPIEGGTPVKLNGPLDFGGQVFYYYGEDGIKISPDSSRVLYVADQDTYDVHELYSVPIGGGTPVKLNGPLVPGGDVAPGSDGGLSISPDSSRAVYRADQDTDGAYELYSVPITGGTPVKLNEPAFAPSGIRYQISADSSRVVYLAFSTVNETAELYSVPIAGGTPVELNGPLLFDRDVHKFCVSADSRWVVYTADQDTDEVFELYSVPVAGGTPVKLNGPLAPGGDVHWLDDSFDAFAISPDSCRVVYLADQDANGVDELYSVPIGGGTAVQLNGTLVPGGDVTMAFAIGPDSRRVVYVADQDTDNVYELYSVPIGGGTALKLHHGALVPSGVGPTFTISVSPDATRVVYEASEGLCSVPIGGGTVVNLKGPYPVSAPRRALPDGPPVTPDSSRVVYRWAQDSSGVGELYSVPIGGGTAVKLSGTLVEGGSIARYIITADPRYVVYSADQDVDGVLEVYSSYDDSLAWTPPTPTPAPSNVEGGWDRYR